MDRAALPPTWLEELLELLQTRRRLAVVVALAVAGLGVLLALIAPGILPPSAGVGAAVGIAACLLAVAAIVGIDAGDLKVRGARHVRAAGAAVAAVHRGAPGGPGTEAVAARLEATGAHRLALVPTDDAGRDTAVALVNAVGEAWARAGRRVLVMDLTRPDDAHAGIVDVARGTVPLGEAVTFDPELMLARLGAGSDLETALIELPALAPRLPADIERVVVALPSLTDPAARSGASAMTSVFVLARNDRTSRVDLLATLEALDVGGVDAEVLLDRPADESAPPSPPPVPALVDHPEPDPDGPEPGGLGDDGAPTVGVDPTEVAPSAPEERGPRPVMAARERQPTDEVEPAHDADGAHAEHVPSPPSPSLLGMDEIEREVEAESALQTTGPIGIVRLDEPATDTGDEVVAPASDVLDLTDDVRSLPAFADADLSGTDPSRVRDARAPLRAVAHDVPAPEAAEQRRPLRAVGADERDTVALPPELVAGVEPEVFEDDLATTAVLETLAQEIWSRENLGGTA